MENFFYSIDKQRLSTVKIKRSVFICTMEYVESIGQAKDFIAKISKENQTAAHNCWAYITGEKGQIFHSSDAGEPSGSAGKPMLNTLQSFCMTNIAVVVTRHFGGVKLGVRGLIEAYGQSVKNTLVQKKLKKLVQTVTICIDISYEFNDFMLSQIKNDLTRIHNTSYTDRVVHTIEIETEHFSKVQAVLSEYQSREKLKYSIISQQKECGI